MEDKKENMLKAMSDNGGNISEACKSVGVDRRQYYRWRRSDPDFAEASDEIREAATDYVEDQLMERIREGDVTATVFYLKTRGKRRGYSTAMIHAGADGVDAEQQGTPVNDAEDAAKAEEAERAAVESKKKLVNKKKDYLVRLLKKQGKYSAEMSLQAKIAAQLLVRCDELEEEIARPSHKAVRTEYSREGNERQVVASSEKLYMLYLTQAQRALRALGMNTEGKERKTKEGNGLDKFLKAFGDDD